MAIVREHRKLRVFVDTSNLIYTAFYSSWKYYCERFDVDASLITANYEIGDDKDFLNMFTKKFDKLITDTIAIKTMVFSWSDVWFCMDCPRDEIWRRSIAPEYKGDREAKKKKYSPYQGSWKNLYKYINDIMLPLYEEERGCKVVRVDNTECDDIIGVIIPTLPDSNNLIISSDHDYVQLGTNATVISPTGRMLSEEFPDPIKHLKEKILSGDKSDCIPQVFKLHGPKSKRLARMMEDDEYMKEQFLKDPSAVKRYRFNEALIDMKKVPDYIKVRIAKEVKRVLNKNKED